MTTFMWIADESKHISFRNATGILAKYVSFLDVAFTEMKPRFIQENRTQYECYGLLAEVVI